MEYWKGYKYYRDVDGGNKLNNPESVFRLDVQIKGISWEGETGRYKESARNTKEREGRGSKEASRGSGEKEERRGR